MTQITIDLTKDFNARPFGRYLRDSDRSAQAFRDGWLIPRLRDHDQVTVDLSGTNFYGSSFLEEAFGGLVRNGFAKAALQAQLKVVHSKLPSIVEEVWIYIDEAENCQERQVGAA